MHRHPPQLPFVPHSGHIPPKDRVIIWPCALPAPYDPQAGHLPHREGHLFMKRNPTQNSEWRKAQKFLVSGGAPGFGFHHVVWCSSRWWRRSSGRWWCLMPRSFPPKLCHPRLHSTSPLRPLTTPTLPPPAPPVFHLSRRAVSCFRNI